MPLYKLNKKGQYTPFPGMTVVGHVHKEDSIFCKTLYDSLVNCEQFMQYYSPLPPDSYHMTAVNLYTEAEIGSNNWEKFVTSNQAYFESLHQAFRSLTFKPEFQIKSVVISGAVQLVGKLSKELVSHIKDIAHKHGVKNKVPNEFHITLGYQYKAFEAGASREVQESITAVLDKALQTHRTISLNQPKLCYFKDMTAFIPWDGTHFPFERRTARFSFYHKSPHPDSEPEARHDQLGKSSSCTIM